MSKIIELNKKEVTSIAGGNFLLNTAAAIASIYFGYKIIKTVSRCTDLCTNDSDCVSMCVSDEISGRGFNPKQEHLTQLRDRFKMGAH